MNNTFHFDTYSRGNLCQFFGSDRVIKSLCPIYGLDIGIRPDVTIKVNWIELIVWTAN